MQGYNITPYALGTGEFQLHADASFLNWGSYSPTHVYSTLYAGIGAPVSLGVFDGDDSNPASPVQNPSWYADNAGSLSVAIYPCNPTTGTLVVDKDTIGGNGTFNFTSSDIPGPPDLQHHDDRHQRGRHGSVTFSNLAPGT